MNQENALPRRKAMLYYPSQPKPRPVRLREKDRDPYDGLRPWSAITHGIGAALALLGTVLLLLRCAALSLSPWHVVSFLIYGVSMVGLYTASTLYHCRNVSVKGRIALRKYDHASIYFLIAGTYTPICLVVLRTDGAWGWALFGVIWALALAGLVLTLAWMEPAVEEAAAELEEPPQAVRAAAAPQAAAAVRNERREIFFISLSSFRAVRLFRAAASPVPGSRSLLLILEYRKTAPTGMELFRAGLYFLQAFLKKMHFLMLKSVLS